MFEIIFIILVSLYILVAIKIEEWITISALGFRIETPEMFLTHPEVYDVVRAVLFLLAVVTLFLISIKILSGVILAVAWIGAGWIGRIKAFNNYRFILREMMSTAENEHERAEYYASSQKTNQELREIVQISMKYGI